LKKINASKPIQDGKRSVIEKNVGAAALFGNFMDDSLMSASDDNVP